MALAARRLVPTFYQHADHGPVVEIRTGPEAGADTVIEKINAEHAQLFPEEYARFVQSYGLDKPTGTSLRKIPGVDDTMVSILSLHGITSAEQFAELNDAQVAGLMPSSAIRNTELRDVARLLVGQKPAPAPATKPVDDMEMAGTIEALRAKLAAAERDRDAALELATGGPTDEQEDEPGEDETEEAGEKPRRGRSPKAR